MSVGATGFGNRTQVQPEFGDDQTSYNVREGPYSGHGDSKYGSGATHGAGFGNKHSQGTSSSEDNDLGEILTKATSSSSAGGSVGATGFGNRTSSHDTHDSTLGKIMEKVGGMVHHEGLSKKGSERRASQGYSAEEGK